MTEEDKRVLHGIGALVMRHLEIVADRKALKFNQRMAEGLGRFVAKHGAYKKEPDHARTIADQTKVDSDDIQHTIPDKVSSQPAGDTGNATGLFDNTFGRASAIIRDALLVDGVVFVDVDEGLVMSLSSSDGSEPQRDFPDRNADVLGSSGIFDWTDSSGPDGQNSPYATNGVRTDNSAIPNQATIHRLLTLFPQGTILTFDDPTPPEYEVEDSRKKVDNHMEFLSDIPIPPSSDEVARIFLEIQRFLPNCAAVCKLTSRAWKRK